MRTMLISIFLILTLIGPIYLVASGQIHLNNDYRTANRATANIAPDPKTHPEAVVQVYSARAFNWHGIFGSHIWIATKPANSMDYTVYQVVGWRKYSGLPVVTIQKDIPDRYWFDQKPELLKDVRGNKATQLIPEIDHAAQTYPYPSSYVLWPGPNSNTFIAYVIRNATDFHIAMPASAIGKDFLTGRKFLSRATSGTGYQFSIFGLLGVTVAYEEGLEINLLGLVYGINPFKLSIKLPAIGEVYLKQLWQRHEK